MREKGAGIHRHHRLTFYRCVNKLGTSTEWNLAGARRGEAKANPWPGLVVVRNKKLGRKFACTVHITYLHETCGGRILHVL